jgi:hypothetical protein
LVCNEQSLVGRSQPASGLVEPAIFPDGLRLFAPEYSGPAVYVTERVALDQPFGPWTQTSQLPSGTRDPTFFSHLGQVYAVISNDSGTKPRTLVLCELPDPTSLPTCTELQVVVDGAVVTYDMDGPHVRLSGGEPLMVLNVSPPAGSEPHNGDIYFARPETTDLARWQATQLPLLSDPVEYEDDPTLGVGSGLLVYALQEASSAPWTLWMATGFSEIAPYVQHTGAVEGLLDVELNHCDPELNELPPGEVELYFCGGWPDAPRIYSARCSLE